jgi:hypothetical protein
LGSPTVRGGCGYAVNQGGGRDLTHLLVGTAAGRYSSGCLLRQAKSSRMTSESAWSSQRNAYGEWVTRKRSGEPRADR